MIRCFSTVLLFCVLNSDAQIVTVTDFGVKPNSFADATRGVQQAIEKCRNNKNTVVEFPTGRYDFWPDEAVETKYYISNTSSEKEVPVKTQRAGLFLKHLKNVTLEGNGSLFVFHGKIITWVLDSCENISIKNLSVNYERPGMSEMTIKEITASSVLAAIHPDSKFAIINGRLEWYGEKWLARNFHTVLVKPKEGTLFYSSWDPFLKSQAVLVAPLQVRFSGDFSKFKADTGDVLTIRDRYRDYVGAFQNRSKNIRLHNIRMYSMHGLGIVSQFCENLNYDSVSVAPEDGSGRMIASSADGMHFSGCKGQITIDHCHFKGLHDDPVNVHGTHLQVSEILSPSVIKIRFMHHQTYGFQAFTSGDSVGYVHSKSLQVFGQGVVKSAKLVSEREMILEMQQPFSKDLKTGDALENITWTPALTIRNSRFEGIISRGTLVTTRRKVLIENNIYYRTGMHAILIENDASGWYESGPVLDLTIRNNQFIECGFNSSPNNYVISINPQNHQMVANYWVHKNIRIENNTFTVYDNLLVTASSTYGLTFINNQVKHSTFLPSATVRPAISLVACSDVLIKGNSFYTEAKPVAIASKMSTADIKSDIELMIK